MASNCSCAYSLVLQQARRTLETEAKQGANKQFQKLLKA